LNLLRVGRQKNSLRHYAKIGEPVALIRVQLFVGANQLALPDDGAEFLQDASVHGCLS
jgi:hypothetical protein